MQIQTQAQIVVHQKIDIVFDASVNCQNLPKFFTGYKAIPAIVSARTMNGLPLQEGSIRIVENSDGSSIEEAIVALKRPDTQQYALVKGFKPPFSWLVRSASGSWFYETVDSYTSDQTKIIWNFYFEIPNIFSYLVFRLAVQKLFQRAQEICLENLRKYVEEMEQPDSSDGEDLHRKE